MYRVKNGNQLRNRSEGKSQNSLAEEFGIKQHQLSKYKKLQQLIPITLNRCIIELERLYGIKKGRPEKSWDSPNLKTQSQLAEETNLRQRGIGNTNPIKLSRCIIELERLYGSKHGGDRKSSSDGRNLKLQSQLAEEIGIKKSQFQEYKKLQQLIPITLNRCIIELERLYGIRKGRPEKSWNGSNLKTQSQLIENQEEYLSE